MGYFVVAIFYWWKKPECPEKPPNFDRKHENPNQYTLESNAPARAGFQLHCCLYRGNYLDHSANDVPLVYRKSSLYLNAKKFNRFTISILTLLILKTIRKKTLLYCFKSLFKNTTSFLMLWRTTLMLNQKYTANEIIKMLDFLIEFGGLIF